jgi:hypothetical protein
MLVSFFPGLSKKGGLKTASEFNLPSLPFKSPKIHGGDISLFFYFLNIKNLLYCHRVKYGL